MTDTTRPDGVERAGRFRKKPVVIDAYGENPPNGAFIVIDADSNATAAVGFVAAERASTDDDF